MVKEPTFLIGIAGGTASGKTTVCEQITARLQDRRVAIVNMDSFYRGLSPEEQENVATYNFDHPDAFDWEEIRRCMSAIKRGESLQIPIYDFVTHSRCADKSTLVSDYDVVLFEGILVFYDEEIRNMMDMKLFVDTDADVRLARRVRRDINDRGRDLVGILNQYEMTVKPAFDEFVLPTMKYADVIIPRGSSNTVAIDIIVEHIRVRLERLREEREVA